MLDNLPLSAAAKEAIRKRFVSLWVCAVTLSGMRLDKSHAQPVPEERQNRIQSPILWLVDKEYQTMPTSKLNVKGSKARFGTAPTAHRNAAQIEESQRLARQEARRKQQQERQRTIDMAANAAAIAAAQALDGAPAFPPTSNFPAFGGGMAPGFAAPQMVCGVAVTVN